MNIKDLRIKLALILSCMSLIVVLCLIAQHQKTLNIRSYASEQQAQSQISTYCENPDPSIDKYIALTGVNNATCDMDNPCQTAEYAVGKAAAEPSRHRVYARGGTYQTRVLFNTYSGTEAQPIIFCGKYNDEQATFQEPAVSTVGGGDGLIETIRPYYVISDFVVTGNSTNRSNSNGHGWNGIFAQARTEDWSNNHGHHVIVINNKVSNFWHSGVSFAGTDQGNYGQAIQNEIFNNDLENYPKDQVSSGWGSGLGSYRSSNLQIIGNHVHHNFGEGIGMNNSTNMLISQNDVHDNYSVQIYIDSSHFAIAEKNFAYSTFDASMYRCNSGCGCQPGPALAMSGETNSVGDTIIKNNILTNTASNLNFFNGGYASNMTNTKIYNNTIFNSTDSCRSNISISNFGGTGNEIRDNIIAQPTGNSQHLISSTSIGSYTMDHNDWYGGTGSHPTGVGDLTADPQLLNPILTAGPNQPENYTVQSTSSVIDAGSCLADVSTDFWDTTRPQNNICDIGSYEFTTAPSVTPTASPFPIPTSTVTPSPTSVITPTTSPDPYPPTLTFVSPINGSMVPRNHNITITVNALDNVAVTRVEFRVNNTLLCTDRTSPFNCNWHVPAARGKTYILSATAYDAANNSIIQRITVRSN